jgi:hypothetical protein
MKFTPETLGRLSTPKQRIMVNDGKDFIEVQEVDSAPGFYAVVGDSLRTQERPELLFNLSECSALVMNQDFDSDWYGCFEHSLHVQVGDCDFTPDAFRAQSFEELVDAAKEIRFTSGDNAEL